MPTPITSCKTPVALTRPYHANPELTERPLTQVQCSRIQCTWPCTQMCTPGRLGGPPSPMSNPCTASRGRGASAFLSAGAGGRLCAEKWGLQPPQRRYIESCTALSYTVRSRRSCGGRRRPRAPAHTRQHCAPPDAPKPSAPRALYRTKPATGGPARLSNPPRMGRLL